MNNHITSPFIIYYFYEFLLRFFITLLQGKNLPQDLSRRRGGRRVVVCGIIVFLQDLLLELYALIAMGYRTDTLRPLRLCASA